MMDDEGEQTPLFVKAPNSVDDDIHNDVTVATNLGYFCGNFKDPSSRCHNMIILVFISFLSFGE